VFNGSHLGCGGKVGVKPQGLGCVAFPKARASPTEGSPP